MLELVNISKLSEKEKKGIDEFILSASTNGEFIHTLTYLAKLTHLDELNSEKHRSAEQYDLLINNKQVLKPSIRPNTNHIWHQYVVRCESRDELQNYLEANRIGTIIHYSIPMYNGMTQKEIQYVVDAINHFT